MFAASKSGGVVAGTSGDPYWTSVSLLTNFENSLTFQDGSTNNFAITRNGVVNPSLNTPFSGGVGGSGYFNGATGYLTTPNNAVFQFGTGDFTVEAWVYLVTKPINARLFSLGNFSGAGNFQVEIPGSTGNDILIHINGAFSTYTYTVPLTTWFHIAVCRVSGTVKVYINGTSLGSNTQAGSVSDATNPFAIGAQSNGSSLLNGCVSNARIVKGTAVYTANFTPPTAPLTAITNTSLLITGTGQGMFNNSTFVDQGPKALTVTATGSPVYSGLSPFGNTYPGSVLYNGSTSYLSTPNNTNLQFGTGSFTIEFWYLRTGANGTYARYFQLVDGDVISGISISQNNTTQNGILITVSSNGATYDIVNLAAVTITDLAWNHVALVRNGTNFTIYINGVGTSLATSSASIYYTGTGSSVIGGQLSPSRSLAGVMSNFRIVKGTAVYTANFTPSTTPLTAITNTSLLVRGDTGAFYDLSNNGLALTANGASSTLSVAASKFGTLSTVYNGTQASGINVAISALLNMPGDFTFEAWSNVPTATSQVAYPAVYSGATGPNIGIFTGFASSNNFTAFGATPSFTIASTVGAKDSTWHFLTLVRSGTTVTFYVDGVSRGTATTSTAFDFGSASSARIGASSNGAADGPFNGYIDSMRITKGVARYTANFTPPTTTFPLGP